MIDLLIRIPLEYFTFLPILPIVIFLTFFFYRVYKKSVQNKNFSELVSAQLKWIEEMVIKHQLTGWVRKKSYKKLIKDQNLTSRFELLGPMLFYIQHNRRTPTRFLNFLQRWVKCTQWPYKNGSLVSFFLFLSTIFLLYIWSKLSGYYFWFLLYISITFIGIYIILLIITMLMRTLLEHLSSSYVWYKRQYTIDALSLIEQCKYIVILTETLKKIEIQNAASDTSDILQQIRETFKQIAKTWILYIKNSKAPIGSGVFYNQEKDIPEEEYHKEVFRWITDMTSEIESIIQSKLWLIAEGMSAHKSEISQLQTTNSEFSANGILELQKQRLTVLEESINRSFEPQNWSRMRNMV